LDQGWYGLITDLDQRGLIDDTLVVCTSEHGRTPKITTGQGGGRDHWSRVYASLLAGGGTKRGFVLGASDKQGGDVLDRPTSPKELLATMYHLLGIDHRMLVHDTLGRPLPLVDAEIIAEVLA
jgi:arylsulfatase A-like enzyme